MPNALANGLTDFRSKSLEASDSSFKSVIPSPVSHNNCRSGYSGPCRRLRLMERISASLDSDMKADFAPHGYVQKTAGWS